MGFFKSVVQAVTNSVKTISNPSKMLSMREDVLRPGGSLTLDDFFKRVDPVLDTLDPMHNIVQERTTGSSTTEGQSPYFQTIAPIIVDVFFPGAGSMAAGISNISDGNTAKGVTQFAGGYISQVGSAYSAIGQGGSWIGAAGSAVKIGATAYAVYDRADNLKGYYGAPPPNLVSTTQQAAPAYASTGAGTAYGKFTNAVDPADNAAAVAANRQKALTTARDKNIALLALIAGALALTFGKI
ncbi:hypothetical protein [uncultured Dechloromonas sp.]|uniref:hypothetical protein n=1 Tax=uncultured Dechloromonas sp. TaxID=171719 RepID=UPI0025FFF2BA|nr:hypothetical protein [uncultured Dechloromonas sp.]